MELPALVDVGYAAAALLSIGALVAAVVRVVKRAVGKALGELDERLDHKLAPLHAQMHTNGGASLRDAINDIRSTVNGMDGEVRGWRQVSLAIERRLEQVEKRLDAAS